MFYSEEFNEQKFGIDMHRHQNKEIFFIKEIIETESKIFRQKADLELMDPICESKNMTRNCYLYP
jgi:hypothetical protein